MRTSLLHRAIPFTVVTMLLSGCGGGDAPATDQAADTAGAGGMVTGTTGAPGPGTVGTPGTPAAPRPDTVAPDTLERDTAATDVEADTSGIR